MPNLVRLGNVGISVFCNDTQQHRQPRFHAVSPNEAMVIAIPSLAKLAGSMGQPSHGAVIAWARANLTLLKATWNRCNPQMPIR